MSKRLLFCLIFLATLSAFSEEVSVERKGGDRTLRVMSFNLWHGGEGGVLPLERTAEVIRAARADIVGVQESYGRERDSVRPDNARKVAALLGWNHADQGSGKTVLSRFPIVGLTSGRHGALIELPEGETVYLFNVHLYHAPYQPYQLLGIDYEDAPFLDNEEALIAAAEAARGPELAATLAEMRPLLESGRHLLLTGDFNEPSHLDWTERAVSAGVAPMKVAYPASRQTSALGLVDAYRAAHPDVSTALGHTWTPTTRPDDPADRHDRIDFVYVSPSLQVRSCEVVGESESHADIVVRPFPSDHRAVVAEVSFPAR